jgi:hypothetical protein
VGKGDMMRKLCSLSLLVIVLLISGCGSSGTDPKLARTSEENINIGKVIRSGEFVERADTEILPQNNCGNKSSVQFSVNRERTLEQSVDLTFQGEIGGELGIDLVGKITAAIGAEYGQNRSTSIVDSGGMEFTIEAGDFPNYTVVWREKWEKGYITVQYNGEETEISYLYLSTARPELINVEYKDCSTGETLQEQPPTSTVLSNEQENCVSTPPNGLIHFWQEGSRFWSWGIWGSENLIDFTVALGEIDTDDPDFGEFQLWLDPCLKDTVPGHGYENNARFWSIEQKGSGLTSPPIILGQETIITLKANTGKYALGNP